MRSVSQQMSPAYQRIHNALRVDACAVLSVFPQDTSQMVPRRSVVVPVSGASMCVLMGGSNASKEREPNVEPGVS